MRVDSYREIAITGEPIDDAASSDTRRPLRPADAGSLPSEVVDRKQPSPKETYERILNAAASENGRIPRSPTSPSGPSGIPAGATSVQIHGLTVNPRPSLAPAQPTPEQAAQSGVADTLYRPASAASGVTSSYQTDERMLHAASSENGRIPRSPTSPPPAPAGIPAGATSVQFHGLTVNLRPSLAPAHPTPEEAARFAIADTLYRPASAASGVTSSYLNQDDMASNPRVQAVAQGRRIESGCLGCTLLVMRGAASSTRGANLFDSANAVRKIYARGGQIRSAVLSSIRSLQSSGQWSGDSRELPGYTRHPGTNGLRSGLQLVSDLEDHFATPYTTPGRTMGQPNTFALIGLSLSNSPSGIFSVERPAHALCVQRLHATGDYRNDAYTLYDPSQGALRYDNFGQMTYALSHYYEAAYPGLGGFTSASTSYYAMQNVLQHPMAQQRLGDVGGSYGIPPALPIPAPPLASPQPDRPEPAPLPIPIPSLTPPRADLPRLPDFDQPGPSGYQPPHHDLKRSADTDSERQPMALYRPSVVSPADLKKLGGFSAEQTPLGQVNVDMHNFDVAADPSVIDGAGYLGTFRKPETAQQNPALTDAKNGYVYAVAPTPNMIDVNATLGPNARRPGTGEVAALGRIDYTQIRGWQKMENGKLGKFTANPDYRWDVYDQTRTAGAQPQLSRFAGTDPAWGDSAHRPFATAQQHDGKTVFSPRQEPNLTQASFYNHALEKIRYLSDQQAQGLDYRGTVKLVSHNGAYGTLQGNVHMPPGQLFHPNGPNDTDVTVTNSAADVSGYYAFRMGDDGRFHTKVLGEDEVLRVGSNGYLYLDYAPTDPQNKNGVFRYTDNHLIHEEDHKVLSYSYAGYAYVSSADYDSDYSQWKLTDGSNKSYAPPKSINLYYDNTAGSARTQYEFDKDPDSALPAGATYFATHIPSASTSYEDTNSFMREATRDQQQQTVDWLNRNQAALLLPDGFYLTATGEHTLEVRNLQGDTIRTVHTDGSAQGDTSYIDSRYRVDERTWARLQSEQERRQKFEELSKTAYAVQ
jgi:hypothetical protein